MRVSNQGGSLAGFVIIGAVLALVLVGGLYGLNRYNTQQHNEAVKSSDESSKSVAKTNQNTTKSDKKAPELPKKSTSDSKKDSTSQSSSSSQTSQQSSGGGSSQLPTTGPSNGLLQLIAVAALSFAGVHYIRSRSYVRANI